MENNRCKATTKSGEQCKLPGGSSGYCHIHDPEKIAEHRAEREATQQAVEDREQLLRQPRFSQRRGFKPVSEVIQMHDVGDELRTSIWNVLYRFIFRYEDDGLLYSSHIDRQLADRRLNNFVQSIWSNLFKKPIHLIPSTRNNISNEIFKYLSSCEWYEFYDFLEYALNYDGRVDLRVAVNQVLACELSGYRFVDSVITEISNEQEIEMLEEVLADDDFPSVRIHLQRALELMSDRENPDYRNSIKESISAVESFSQAITGNPNATLGQALKTLESSSKVKLHPALGSAFSKLYGYTSQEGGIRHAMLEEPNLSVDDAKFFLLTCGAFINYLKSKL